MGQDLCQKLVGTKRGLQIYELSNDKLYCHWTFEASPELNCSNMLSEGQTSTVTMPIMGGLCAVFCKKTSKGYDFVVESDKIGRMEVSCEFSSEGMKRVSLQSRRPKIVRARKVEKFFIVFMHLGNWDSYFQGA